MYFQKSPNKVPTPKPTSDNNLKKYIKYLLIYSIQSLFSARTRTGKFKESIKTHHNSNSYIWFGLNIPLNQGLNVYLKEGLINVVDQMIGSSETQPVIIEVLARCGSNTPILLEQLIFKYERKVNETTNQSHIFFQLSTIIRSIISSLRITSVYYKYFRALPSTGDWGLLRLRKGSPNDSLVAEDKTFTQQMIGELNDFHHHLTVNYTYRNENYNFTELVEYVKITFEEHAKSKKQKSTVKFKRNDTSYQSDKVKFAHLTKLRNDVCKKVQSSFGKCFEIPNFYSFDKECCKFIMPKEDDQSSIESHFPSVADMFVEFYPLSTAQNALETKSTVNSTKIIFKSMEQTISDLETLDVTFGMSNQETQFEISY